DDRWLGSIDGTFPSGKRMRTQVVTTWNTIDSDFTSPFGPSTSGSKRWTLRGQSDVHVSDGFDVSAGARFLRHRATSAFITDATGEIPVKRSVAGIFGEARWSSQNRLFVPGGVRVDDIRRDALPGVSDPFSPRPAFAADSIVSTNPKVAAAWIARPD